MNDIKDLFDRWAGGAGDRYAREQWLLSKWEVMDGVIWPPEKIGLMRDTIIAGLRPAPMETLVDLGCGGGWILHQLQPFVRQGAGLDFSAPMLDQARRFCPESVFVRGEIGRLPFRTESFDCALCYFVFINFRDEAYTVQALEEIARVLKKGGRALIGQLPDARQSAAYDRAKAAYMQYCRTTFSLGESHRDHCRVPQALFERRALQRHLNRTGLVYEFRDAFNPFFRPGEPETVSWRFDIILSKPL